MLVLYLFLGLSSLAVAIKAHSAAGNQLHQQVFSWWRIFPVVSVSLFLYPIGALLLTVIISCLAMRELASHYTGDRQIFFGFCFVFLAVILALSYTNFVGWMLLLPALLSVQYALFMRRRNANYLLLLLFLLSSWGVSFIVQFTQMPLPADKKLAWLFYLFVLTALNDVAQFISGKCFGTRYIAKRISPNKTWQGLAGGVVTCMALSELLGGFLQLAEPVYLLLLAILLSLTGFAGDLLFSAAKRVLGIKDFSHLIPGHGGILDRVDSLVLTAPLLYFAISLSPNS